MSFFSGLFSSNKSEQQPPSEPSSSQQLFNTAKWDTPKPSQPSSSTSSPSSSFPSSTSASAPPPPNISNPEIPTAPTAFDTFSSAYDPAKLHPLAKLGDKLDFLHIEEDKLNDTVGAQGVLPSRGWTDDLCVGTGTTYLSGLAIGGAWGLREGLARPLGNNPSMRLRINAILNGCTRRGSFLGNSLGVLAIFYNIVNSTLDNYRGRHDAFNSMTAAALSGAIYKSTAGVRPAMVGAGLMTLAAGGWSYVKTVV